MQLAADDFTGEAGAPIKDRRVGSFARWVSDSSYGLALDGAGGIVAIDSGGGSAKFNLPGLGLQSFDLDVTVGAAGASLEVCGIRFLFGADLSVPDSAGTIASGLGYPCVASISFDRASMLAAVVLNGAAPATFDLAPASPSVFGGREQFEWQAYLPAGVTLSGFAVTGEYAAGYGPPESAPALPSGLPVSISTSPAAPVGWSAVQLASATSLRAMPLNDTVDVLVFDALGSYFAAMPTAGSIELPAGTWYFAAIDALRISADGWWVQPDLDYLSGETGDTTVSELDYQGELLWYAYATGGGYDRISPAGVYNDPAGLDPGMYGAMQIALCARLLRNVDPASVQWALDWTPSGTFDKWVLPPQLTQPGGPNPATFAYDSVWPLGVMVGDGAIASEFGTGKVYCTVNGVAVMGYLEFVMAPYGFGGYPRYAWSFHSDAMPEGQAFWTGFRHTYESP